jgi:M6 family metalloprotease-like protein
MKKHFHPLDRMFRSAGAVALACFLAVLILLAGTIQPAAASEAFAGLPEGPRLIPPPPEVIERLKREGYDEAAIAEMLNRSRNSGVDRLEESLAPVLGTKKVLVLLIDFPDKVRKSVSTPAFYNRLLFSDGTYPAPGSMRDFYQINSYGKFDLAGATAAWVRASHNSAYYAPQGGQGPYPQNAAGLVREAVLAANSSVNFANYAEGGVVKYLIVVHAGIGNEVNPAATNLIWSHQWSITGAGGQAVVVDGVTVDPYVVAPEFYLSPGDSTMGIFAHEFGHSLGLPDLYDTSNAGTGSDLGIWSLMSGGSWNSTAGRTAGSSPASMDPWSKIRLGWIKPIVLKSDVANKLIPPVYGKPVVYKLWKQGKPGKEYFLVENRQKLGFDAPLPGAGLLIYHVDDNKFTFPEQGERCINHKNWLCGAHHGLIALEQADALFELEKDIDLGDPGDPFPGTANRKNVNFNTTPNFSSYASPANTLVQVLNIRKSGRNVIATMKVGAAASGFNSQFTTNAAGWKPLNGTWNITANGFYHTTGIANKVVSSMYNSNFPTLTYTVKMRRTGCATCLNHIYFRGGPGALTPAGDWINGYAFGYNNNGSFIIWAQSGGTTTILLDWTESSAITSSWNVLKVTAKGTFVQFFINNTLVASGDVTDFNTGKVGVGFFRDGSAGNHLYVDWATLQPSAPAGDEGPGVPEEGIWIDESNAIILDSPLSLRMRP